MKKMSNGCLWIRLANGMAIQIGKKIFDFHTGDVFNMIVVFAANVYQLHKIEESVSMWKKIKIIWSL